jgi:hypothetical protein
MVPNMGGEPHCFGYLDSAGGIAETTAMVAARSEVTFMSLGGRSRPGEGRVSGSPAIHTSFGVNSAIDERKKLGVLVLIDEGVYMKCLKGGKLADLELDGACRFASLPITPVARAVPT